MTKHILDQSKPRSNRRAMRRFVVLDQMAKRGGLSDKISALDRSRRVRKSRIVAAYTAIERGRVI